MEKNFIQKGADRIVDLTKASLNFFSNARIRSSVIVDDDMVSRPDLVSMKEYGKDSMYDYILKYNGISNPVSLESGQLLMIPDPDDMDASFKRPDSDSNFQMEKKLNPIAIVPKTEKDATRLDFFKQKTGKNEILPPNVNKPSDQNIKFKDGRIVFGEDVTRVNKENCPETVTRARVKEKLMYKKLFG